MHAEASSFMLSTWYCRHFYLETNVIFPTQVKHQIL